MLGLFAFDQILWLTAARMMDISLEMGRSRQLSNDSPANASRFGIPGNPVADLEHFCGTGLVLSRWHQFSPCKRRESLASGWEGMSRWRGTPFLFHNQPSASSKGRVRPCPLGEDKCPVFESDQIENMYKEPGQPGSEPAELKPGHLNDRSLPSDRGQHALVLISKGKARQAQQSASDVLRGMSSLLHRHGCQSR